MKPPNRRRNAAAPRITSSASAPSISAGVLMPIRTANINKGAHIKREISSAAAPHHVFIPTAQFGARRWPTILVVAAFFRIPGTSGSVSTDQHQHRRQPTNKLRHHWPSNRVGLRHVSMRRTCYVGDRARLIRGLSQAIIDGIAAWRCLTCHSTYAP